MKNLLFYSQSWGNINNSHIVIENPYAKYAITDGGMLTWYDEPYGEIDQGIVLTTGASNSFKRQNIFDLAGNCNEVTLEYSTDEGRSKTARGSYMYNGAGSRSCYET